MPWLSLGRIPEKQGILSDEKCRLALPFTAHSSLFAVPVTHQMSARGYKRYFSLLTQARMFLSSRCTESPISCEGLLRPASPPGEGRAEPPSCHTAGVLLIGNTMQPGPVRLDVVGQGLPPTGSDVWDSHLADNHWEIHVNARML